MINGCVLILLSFYYGQIEKDYIGKNSVPIVLAALGVIGINVLLYVVITKYGASWMILNSLIAMLIPPTLVGYVIFKERFNLWILPAMGCAILAGVFFALSKQSPS